MTARPEAEIWSLWLGTSGDFTFWTFGNCASVDVTSLIVARKAGSFAVCVFDRIRTTSPCSFSFCLKPAAMILSALRASPTLASVVFRYFVPTVFPTKPAAMTNTSQPMTAVFQCFALQRPMRAAV